MACKALSALALDTFPLNSQPLFLSFSAPATLTSRLFLKVVKEAPASGLLHLPVHLPQVLDIRLIKTLFSNTSPLKSHLIRILPFHSVPNHLWPLSHLPPAVNLLDKLYLFFLTISHYLILYDTFILLFLQSHSSHQNRSSTKAGIPSVSLTAVFPLLSIFEFSRHPVNIT